MELDFRETCFEGGDGTYFFLCIVQWNKTYQIKNIFLDQRKTLHLGIHWLIC